MEFELFLTKGWVISIVVSIHKLASFKVDYKPSMLINLLWKWSKVKVLLSFRTEASQIRLTIGLLGHSSRILWETSSNKVKNTTEKMGAKVHHSLEIRLTRLTETQTKAIKKTTTKSMLMQAFQKVEKRVSSGASSSLLTSWLTPSTKSNKVKTQLTNTTQRLTKKKLMAQLKTVVLTVVHQKITSTWSSYILRFILKKTKQNKQLKILKISRKTTKRTLRISSKR